MATRLIRFGPSPDCRAWYAWRMKRYAAICALALAIFVAGIAAAKAEFGWERIAAPCAVASLAVNGSEIAVVCEADRNTILIKR